MNLFDYGRHIKQKDNAPLARRMRPESLEEYVGQSEIIGPGKLLRRAIEADKISSVIFYGPPGVGKTALAQIIAKHTEASFVRLNAVTAGINEIRQVIKEAKDRLGMYGKRTILFIDEIHRFNKSQQDALLPYVEDGLLTFIGATTENPYFEVNSALLSRSQIFSLEKLLPCELDKILNNALENKEKGLGNLNVKLSPKARKHIIEKSDGDARKVLNALELAVLTTPPDEEGIIVINLEVAEQSIQHKAILYDKSGDQHYDVISAFIKSIRGSDPDASIHWLARMLEAGEDPRFIARRMIILAAEDIGLADPRALNIAVSAAQALEYVGMPEARLPLTEACLYLACAPKSNAVIKAIDGAVKDIKEIPIGVVPNHLKDAHYKGAQNLEHGLGYVYPHDYPENYVKQNYLPEALKGKKYYTPSENGEEKEIKVRMYNWHKKNEK
jgi:putative ATPase